MGFMSLSYVLARFNRHAHLLISQSQFPSRVRVDVMICDKSQDNLQTDNTRINLIFESEYQRIFGLYSIQQIKILSQKVFKNFGHALVLSRGHCI